MTLVYDSSPLDCQCIYCILIGQGHWIYHHQIGISKQCFRIQYMKPPVRVQMQMRVEVHVFHNICNTRAHTAAYLKVDAIHLCIRMRIHNGLTGAFHNVNHNVRVMLIACLSPNVHNNNILRL
jgi:hypothetical protein